ncbi:HAD family hydrolase [Aquisalibacillus elongatus]|uniref:HAD family hydrolase n=1 Tax=Aquisalibacillus elongatus TaxID=485577 RepID=UPI000F530BC6|nr:HAD-IA family hydrolase [Aquisalibacillus elongatus]
MKAVIFDFDGTLADTLPNCFVAFQTVFKKFDDKDLTVDEIKEMFGPSETGIIRENLLNDKKEEAIELYYEEYLENHNRLVESNNEIIEMIRFLKEKRIKVGIVTGKARRSLDISLKALQMDGLFEAIITGDDVVHPKPHPEGVLKALSFLEVESDKSIFVGDSDADIEAGLHANVLTAGVNWLSNGQTVEFSISPDYMFGHVNDLITYIEKGVQSEL